MNMDTLSFVVKSSVDKMKSSMKTMIGLWQQYGNTLNKAKKSMQDVANSNSNADSSFAKSKQQIDEIGRKYKELSNTLKKYTPKYGISMGFKDYTQYDLKDLKSAYAGSKKEEDYLYSRGDNRTDKQNARLQELMRDTADVKNAIKFVEELGMSYNEVVNKVKEYKEQLEQANLTSQNGNKKPLIPKDSADGLRKIGKEASDSRNKVSFLSSSLRTIGSISKSVGSKGFDFLKNKFKDFTKNFGKGVNNNIKEMKKLALGLVGVRTAMSVLTKSVNAYLSFDSELQESLTNSWNMLGSLLAPAIEFVARMFAIATNYVAQFVNALTGIDLVARANAKALITQAKANEKANKAQRGLLGMDEITNLPSEPGGGSDAPQIKMDDSIKSFKALDDILSHLKNGEWHLVGEDIARGIDNLLGSIDWKSVKEKAYNLGYNFGDFLNGLFEVDWSQIGTTVAETMNTFVSTVKGFLDKFSFIQLGGGLARSFNHAFLDFDWDTLTQTINEGIQKIGDGIAIFLETFKWGDIGLQFGNFVRSIDWGNLLFQAIRISILAFQGFVDFLAGFLVGLFWDVIEPFKDEFVALGDQLYNLVDGWLNSIVDFVRTPVDWIVGIFRTMVKSIKQLMRGDLLGAMKTVGKGLANAIISPINGLISGLNLILYPIREVLSLLAQAGGKNISAKNIKIPKIPPLATGTPNIETEGLYHLHEGEMVVPKRYNPNTDGYDSGSDNRQIIDLLISLNSSMLEYANRPIDISMNGKKVAEGIYGNLEEIDKNKNRSNVIVRS